MSAGPGGAAPFSVQRCPAARQLDRRARAQVVLNSLYKQTALQGRFPCNMVALVAGTPQTLTLKQFLQHFLAFRCDVVGRRARCAGGGGCHAHMHH